MYTQERILRYPDGKERVLRYSVEATVDEEAEDEYFLAWDVVGLPGDRIRADHSRQKVRQNVWFMHLHATGLREWFMHWQAADSHE